MAEPPAYPGVPRWVKVVGMIALALVVVFVVVHLAGGGFQDHGHRGEAPSGAAAKSAN